MIINGKVLYYTQTLYWKKHTEAFTVKLHLLMKTLARTGSQLKKQLRSQKQKLKMTI